MIKYRIISNQTGTKFKVQKRFLGIFWWSDAVNWDGDKFVFDTPQEAIDLIAYWKSIEDKWEVYHHD